MQVEYREVRNVLSTLPRGSGLGTPQYGGQNVVKDTPAIPAAHSRLTDSVTVLHKTIGDLLSRLQPAMRIEPQAPTSPGNACPPPSSQISDKIHEAATDVENASARLSEILRLLEI
jgi:hypothetical protein